MERSAEPIDIDSQAFVCDLSESTPAILEVEPGAVLRIHCRNALDFAIGAETGRAAAANPATGPIAVRGARPGQALRLDILAIEPETPGYVAGDWEGGQQAVPIIGGEVDFHGIRLPIDPMVGTVGVLPAEGRWSTMDAGPFGGNMDIRDVAPGASVFLPAFRPGGGFALGDVHAVMGDGEIGGQGLETAATVTLQVGVEPEPLSEHVYLRRHGAFMIVGWGESIEDAVADACAEMIRVIARTGVLDEFNARKFLGLAGDTLFGQHCCRIKTVRVAVPVRCVAALRG